MKALLLLKRKNTSKYIFFNEEEYTNWCVGTGNIITTSGTTTTTGTVRDLDDDLLWYGVVTAGGGTIISSP